MTMGTLPLTFGPKQLGRCLCCARDCFEVLEVHGDGPLAGHPLRLGPMLDCGTQVEFLMSDGTEADITFCAECAARLTPADYGPVWEAVIERTRLSLGGRPESEQRRLLRQYTALFPLAIKAWRRPHAELPQLVIDPRWRQRQEA